MSRGRIIGEEKAGWPHSRSHHESISASPSATLPTPRPWLPLSLFPPAVMIPLGPSVLLCFARSARVISAHEAFDLRGDGRRLKSAVTRDDVDFDLSLPSHSPPSSPSLSLSRPSGDSDDEARRAASFCWLSNGAGRMADYIGLSGWRSRAMLNSVLYTLMKPPSAPIFLPLYTSRLRWRVFATNGSTTRLRISNKATLPPVNPVIKFGWLTPTTNHKRWAEAGFYSAWVTRTH